MSTTCCPFTYRGRPTTKPGTADDEKRIALSQWITEILVRAGDEKPGEYQTPGALTLPDLPPVAPLAKLGAGITQCLQKDSRSQN